MTASNIFLPSELQTKLADLAGLFEGKKKLMLRVAGLESPAVVPVDKSVSEDPDHWTKHRDIHHEIGMSVQTLTSLRLVSGQLVEAVNPTCSAAKIVRVMAVGFHEEYAAEDSDWRSCDTFPRKGWVYLSPMLIQGLGYNWGLMPYLPTVTKSQGYDQTEKIMIRHVDPLCRSLPGGGNLQ